MYIEHKIGKGGIERKTPRGKKRLKMFGEKRTMTDLIKNDARAKKN